LTTINDSTSKLLIALWLLGIACFTSAQTIRYISDEFQIPVHESPRKDFKIVTFVSSGMRVEVLDEEKPGYSLIKAQGLRGWVQTRDLIRIPSASARLAAAEQQFEERRVALEQSKRKVKALQARVDALSQRNRLLKKRKRNVKAHLSALRKRTAKPLVTERQNQQLEQALLRETDAK
jgi:SH3 domain protein